MDIDIQTIEEEIEIKVGDNIVDYSRVYRVLKIKKGVIHYKPHYRSDKSPIFDCSIPLSSFSEGNFRFPMTKNKTEEILKFLSHEKNGEIPVNITEAQDFFKENDPVEKAKLLRLLWFEMQTGLNKLPLRKRMLFEDTLHYLGAEISVVHNITLEQSKKKIIKSLTKFCSERED